MLFERIISSEFVLITDARVYGSEMMFLIMDVTLLKFIMANEYPYAELNCEVEDAAFFEEAKDFLGVLSEFFFRGNSV